MICYLAPLEATEASEISLQALVFLLSVQESSSRCENLDFVTVAQSTCVSHAIAISSAAGFVLPDVGALSDTLMARKAARFVQDSIAAVHTPL